MPTNSVYMLGLIGHIGIFISLIAWAIYDQNKRTPLKVCSCGKEYFEVPEGSQYETPFIWLPPCEKCGTSLTILVDSIEPPFKNEKKAS